MKNSIIQVGRYTYGHNKIEIMSYTKGEKVIIGSFCSIALNCRILLGMEHRVDYVSTFPFGHIGSWNVDKESYGLPTSKGNVTIGNDVWIGHSVTILSGVTIGDGSVIGANAVVSKNIEPYSIVVGNPAKTVKKRFADSQIEDLMKIKWWEWEDKKIKKFVSSIVSTDIDKFIKEHKI